MTRDEHRHHGYTRRDFLRGTALGSLGWGLAAQVGCTQERPPAAIAQPPPTPQPAPGQADRPKVVIARRPEVISEDGQTVKAELVEEMLTAALRELTGQDSLAAALGTFVKPLDRVGLKRTLMITPTHQEVISVLWGGLQQIGVPAENVMTWDRNRGHRGYADGKMEELEYAADHICKICSEWAHVLINLPGLKSHWLSGIGVCLKNWVGAVNAVNVMDQDTPFPIHADACADLGMIPAQPAFQGKMRLHIVDGLRGLFEGGPQVNSQYLWNYGGLIVGTDQVAVDRVCLDLIQKRRNEVKGEDWPVSPPPKHIMVAAEKYGLGEANLERIQVVEV